MKYVEKAGTGTTDMIADCLKAGLPEPDFRQCGLSLLVALGYLVYKLVYWDSFQLGLAPLIIGMFFFGSVQLIFLGIVGEYVGAIHTQVLKRPLVIEKERINFD